jgi:hypothetical protein
MTAELYKDDPYKHLVTISYAANNSKKVLDLPEISFTQVHMYDFRDPSLSCGDVYQEMAALAPGSTFLQGEDLATLAPGKATLSNGLVAQALTLQSNTRLLLWIKNNRYEAAVTDAMLGQPLHGLEVSLSGLKDGNYQVTWYDQSPVVVKNKNFILPVPDFLKDIAARITPR